MYLHSGSIPERERGETELAAAEPSRVYSVSPYYYVSQRGQKLTSQFFSVFKNNRITERVNLQFRAEFFNLLSSEFYFPRTPNNNFSSSDFGSFISKSLTTDGRPVQDTGVLFSPRIIQFGLRLTF